MATMAVGTPPIRGNYRRIRGYLCALMIGRTIAIVSTPGNLLFIDRFHTPTDLISPAGKIQHQPPHVIRLVDPLAHHLPTPGDSLNMKKFPVRAVREVLLRIGSTNRFDIAGRENPAPTATPYPALLAPFRIVYRPPAAYTPPPSSRQGRGPPLAGWSASDKIRHGENDGAGEGGIFIWLGSGSGQPCVENGRIRQYTAAGGAPVVQNPEAITRCVRLEGVPLAGNWVIARASGARETKPPVKGHSYEAMDGSRRVDWPSGIAPATTYLPTMSTEAQDPVKPEPRAEFEAKSRKDRPTGSTHFGDTDFGEEEVGDIGDATWGEVAQACCVHDAKTWGIIFIGTCGALFFLYFFLFSLSLLGNAAKVVSGCQAGGLLSDETNPVA
ncbi:hypothetical protein THAOC_25721, partial [Thalassiosira oceanica]